MWQKRWIATLVALLILVAGWIAGVQLALAKDGDQLAAKYTRLAGSEMARPSASATSRLRLPPARWTSRTSTCRSRSPTRS